MVRHSYPVVATTLLGSTSLSYSLSKKENKKLGIALVGLGSYSRGQLAPGLKNAKYCYLAGIVTGTPSKEKVWMNKYNIPASITLAQGLIETNAGQSPLATKNNNHFGIKCFSKSCKKGHCANFSDDSHKDFFRKYASSWESFRAHSKLLTYKRYKHLTKLPTSDYKGWAVGLKKAGYATDKNYHKKLIRLIEDLHLDDYDK